MDPASTHHFVVVTSVLQAEAAGRRRTLAADEHDDPDSDDGCTDQRQQSHVNLLKRDSGIIPLSPMRSSLETYCVGSSARIRFQHPVSLCAEVHQDMVSVAEPGRS